MHPDTRQYNAKLAPPDRAIGDVLAREITHHLPEAENRIWHGHPVWFLDGNPIVGYSKLKNCVRLLFWSGQSFDEPGLAKEGTFKAAEKRYTSVDDIDREDLARWCHKARDIQWDYKNIVKRKGKLERITATNGFRSLLVPVDFSSQSDRVLARVAQLPLAGDARVTLVHVVPDDLPPSARQRASRDAKRSLAEEHANLAKALPERITVQERVMVGVAATEISNAATDAGAELVVIGRGVGRGIRDLFLGSTAERVIRRAQLPVLAVRVRAHTAYQRPAIALDLEQQPHDVLATMLHLVPPPRPGMTIIHAYDIPYRGLIYPSLTESAADINREYYRQKALHELTQRVSTALRQPKLSRSGELQWKLHLRMGDARTVIAHVVAKERTDLLALATHGYRGVAHAFLGTVAGDVLRRVDCDVLVVPPSQDPPTET